MSSWLDTVIGDVRRPDATEAQQRGQRSAVDLADVGPAPPQRLHDAPLMGLRGYARTVIVRVRSMIDSDLDQEHMLVRSRDDQHRRSDAGSVVSEFDETKSGDMQSQSRASRVSIVSKVSFHESKALATLASKYSMLSTATTPASGAEATEAVKRIISESRYAELVKEREQAVTDIQTIVHGLADHRPFWEQNFCYLTFHTSREARFAVRSIHSAILKGEGVSSVVINAYLI